MTEIYYTKDHEWIKIDGNVGVVGITAYASEQLGDIVFVELVEQSINLKKGDTFGTIESVKAVEEVYLPFPGQIIKRNESVIENPEILQNDPINQGWLVIVKPTMDFSIEELMSSSDYQSKVAPI